MKYLLIFCSLFAFLGQTKALLAQTTPFEKAESQKNRVQYRSFEWEFYASDNFDVYFYGGNESLARLTAQYAEAEFPRLTDLLGFSPYSKIRIFVYQSVEDLQQSNIGIQEQGFRLGGQTNFAKSVVEIAFTTDREAYHKQLTREVADMMLFEMLYGGNIREVLQSSYFLTLPDWFIAGASAYAAEGWSLEMDNFIRVNIHNKKIKNIDNFSNIEARLVGQSIWNYLAESYGKNTISNVLNLTRIVRNERSSIQNTLGINFSEFIDRWYEFYKKQNEPLFAQLVKANQVLKFESKALQRKQWEFSQISLSPYATHAAAVRHKDGKYEVLVQDLSNKKEEIVLKAGIYVTNQVSNPHLPLVAWHKKSQNLLCIFVKNGKYYAQIYSLLESKAIKVEALSNLDNLGSLKQIDWAENGEDLVLAATQNGQSDLFLYNLSSKSLKNLTQDRFDEKDPVFKDDKTLLYVSNEQQEEILQQAEAFREQLSIFHLYELDLTNKRKTPLTNLTSQIAQPSLDEKGQIFCLSNQTGINQLYRFEPNDKSLIQLTNWAAAIEDYSFSNQKLILLLRKEEKRLPFLFENISLENSTFTPKSAAQSLQDLRLLTKIKELRRKQEDRKAEQNEGKIEKNQQIEKEKIIDNQADSTQKVTVQDTTSYQFDTFGKKGKATVRLLKDYDYFAKRAASDSLPDLRLRGAYRYESKFSIDRTVTTFAFDALRNFGLLFEMGMADDLENHRFDMGLFVTGILNFSSGMVYGEYQYLKNRLDYGARIERFGYSFATTLYSQQYSLMRFSPKVAYPINITSRIEVSPFFAQTLFNTSSEADPAIQAFPKVVRNYAGLRLEAIFDNRLTTGANTYKGTFLNAKIEQYVGRNATSFAFLHLEGKHYIKLFKNITWAMRLAYGSSFGQAPKTYRLGGVDNWVFQRQPDPTEVAQEDPFFLDLRNPDAYQNDYSDYLFLQYATPLRGFDYNALFGTNYLLTNLELRIPFLDVFYHKSVRSKFLQNLQLIAFTDIGSAWTGISPFNEQNALNTIEIGGNAGEPFYARVSNFKDPFLWGYGVGVRSKILNYFAKFDVAWGVDDQVRSGAKFYFSLGYDF
ncbi:BamA/TamA family outer membrane protein [Hugenholtzia roseola]|uniref:BamA/TamA family outer membrane protein n=1 Tax=Hugenholtzia roseola TaxID=1002 RepID=UPI00047ED415|nr:BamA/TamA family outer membrane protein [Hugenholtzia roseola]